MDVGRDRRSCRCHIPPFPAVIGETVELFVPERMLLRLFVIEAAGIEHAAEIDLRHRRLDQIGVGIERADDLARRLEAFRRRDIDSCSE